MWKGVTSVSNVGRKRGRAKGVRKIVNLNRGQIVGVGKKVVALPGLNTKIFEGKRVNKVKPLKDNESYEEKLQSFRSELVLRKKQVMHPLERGFSGTNLYGRSIGFPADLKDELSDFDCKVVMQRQRPLMVSNVGRVRNVTTLVVVGNKKGLIGFAKARSRDFRKSAHLARARALKRLRSVQLDGGTIIHDFTSSFGMTTIVCFKMPPGFGVIADGSIKTICNVLGIEDLYVHTIRNSKNRFNMVNAFIFGLTQQKTYQQIADEKQLNLVEFKEENDYLPKIIAKPTERCRTSKEIDPLEIMDFRQYLFGGRVYDISNLNKPENWIHALNYARFLQIHHKHRSRLAVKAKLVRRHGKVESFLTLREKEERIKKFGRLPDPNAKAQKEN